MRLKYPGLKANILDVHGEVGRKWLLDLPGLIAELEDSFENHPKRAVKTDLFLYTGPSRFRLHYTERV